MSEIVSPVEENIFEAAHALMEDVGESFTMEQLEAKAKVSRATIYRRVGNKDALLEHLAHQRGETFEKINVRLSILNAARIVFSEEGLLSATMEQIAEQAKVGVATVYRHFGDKEGLVHAFIEEATPRPVVHALTMQPSDDVAADLEKIIGAAIPFFLENRDILRLVFMGGKKERRYLMSMRKYSDSSLSQFTNYFNTQLEAGRLENVAEPDELALALMGIVLAFSVIGPLHYGTVEKSPEYYSKQIVKLFLNDLRSKA